MDNQNDLLSIQEAAEMLGVHPETLRRWDRSGKLKAIKIGERGDRRFSRSDILKLLNEYKSTKLFEYEGYEVLPYSFGFELFHNRFGSIAKYIVRKQDFVAGFAFAVPGLELFALPHITEPDLEAMVYQVIREKLGKREMKKLSEYTYEFRAGNFIEVSSPDWWNTK